MPDPGFVPNPEKSGDQPTLVSRSSHGSADYTLTDWERQWIFSRISDAHVLHLNSRDVGRAVLQESAQDHETRELAERASSYFGDTHVNVRQKLSDARTMRRRQFAEAKARLDSLDAQAQPVEHQILTEAANVHAQTLKQLDEYETLIDRHIATVKADVTEQRRAAQKQVDDCETLITVPFQQHVDTHCERVQNELRVARAVS